MENTHTNITSVDAAYQHLECTCGKIMVVLPIYWYGLGYKYACFCPDAEFVTNESHICRIATLEDRIARAVVYHAEKEDEINGG